MPARGGALAQALDCVGEAAKERDAPIARERDGANMLRRAARRSNILGSV
eukprot:CAMPEP_0183355406 /NCGR_PEP_ID=MMETSP0164_2-20130417/40274_1 /TAXON_ID=221442 /ORGANISM="Coccolithus pelagicus ssp braarudi, Strain PLY182g" /LENGTH=49 /DNA_ID= /DNA_START= /DNA_END= /DNA_ORIENTATION=